MRRFRFLLSILVISSLAMSCSQESSKPSISGTLTGAGNLGVFFDKVTLTSSSSVVAKADIGPEGNFTIPIESENGFEPGFYRLRVGAKKIFMVLEGTEKNIKIDGDLNNFELYKATIEGAPANQELSAILEKLVARQISVPEVQEAMTTSQSPLAGMLAGYLSFGNRAQDYMETFKAVQTRIGSQNYPADVIADVNNFITNLETAKMMAQSSGNVSVGMEAPDIKLPNPDGKYFALSDLRGKVVLLDFWASWCGPCRRENPNVVDIYNKYNKDGFEVFSVSLDKKGQEDRWVKAIQQDGLKWQYHVSDLQYWQSAPAKMYGVNSIPRTFLIDKDGKIAAVNIRGKENLERELKKLL
ncbi:MAG: TlpA disulfide reductase family protein [Saprospiraceae bacterium]